MKAFYAWLDGLMEKGSRGVAQRSSRRSFVTRIGGALAGVAAVPLLPVARAAEGDKAGYAMNSGDPGDPASCDYWRYCAIDGFLCSCCGGSVKTCPPGTEMSPVTWIGTCQNPADGLNYIISYNDCCGKSSCGNCLCTRNERDKPIYRQFSANDLNWCLGTNSPVYHCSTALIIGTSPEPS